MTQITCTKCQITQPPNSFYTGRKQCKTCRAAIMKASKHRTGQKKCPQCRRFALSTEFHGHVCTKCTNRAKRQARALEAKFKRMDKREDKQMANYERSTKKCPACFQTKSRSEFHKNESRPDRMAHACITCTKADKANAEQLSTQSGKATYTAYQYGKDYIIASSLDDFSRTHRHLTKHPPFRVELSAYMKVPGGPLIMLHAANPAELDTTVQRTITYITSLTNTGIPTDL